MHSGLLTSAALLAALGLATARAHADTIVTDQWYDFGFGGSSPAAVFSPGYATGYEGPLLSGATGDSIYAPTGTSWTITLAAPGSITFTDLQETGDQFQVFVNDQAAIPVAGPLTPSGHTGLAGGYTSAPNSGASFQGNDIGASLLDPAMSSGTFYLPAGSNTITANFIGDVGNGDGAFIIEDVVVAEPGSVSLLAAGLFAAGLMRRRRC